MKNNEEIKNYKSYNDIKEKEIDWLWYPYIPKGMVSIVQGDPKSGKTFMLIDIISRITRGDKKPLSNENFEEGTVILQNSDDPRDVTLKPRLNLLKANCEKVIFVDDEEEPLYFSDLSRLENAIKSQKPCLIVIDPIQAFMGDKDSNSLVQVRKALAPLKILAETYNTAIVLVQHLKKGGEEKAIYKGVGSIDFIGFARSILMVIKDEETDNRNLVHISSNVAKEGNCLLYRINDNGLEWIESKKITSVNSLFNQTNGTKFDNAKNFIYGALASSKELSADELSSIAIIGGFSERTFNGARSELNKEKKIYSFKKGNKTYWSLLNPFDDKVQSCKENEKVHYDEK